MRMLLLALLALTGAQAPVDDDWHAAVIEVTAIDRQDPPAALVERRDALHQRRHICEDRDAFWKSGDRASGSQQREDGTCVAQGEANLAGGAGAAGLCPAPARAL